MKITIARHDSPDVYRRSIAERNARVSQWLQQQRGRTLPTSVSLTYRVSVEMQCTGQSADEFAREAIDKAEKELEDNPQWADDAKLFVLEADGHQELRLMLLTECLGAAGTFIYAKLYDKIDGGRDPATGDSSPGSS